MFKRLGEPVEPDAGVQIRVGIIVCLVALGLVLALTFLPDPFFRNREYVTLLDDVAGVQPGTTINFRGARVGEVRSVDLDPATRRFLVALSVTKRWRPTACSQVAVSAANPLTAPTITVEAIEGDAVRSAKACLAERLATGCDPLEPPASFGKAALTGCRRSPDLVQTATRAIEQASLAARTASTLVMSLQAEVSGGAGKGKVGAMMDDATQTAAALNSLATQLDRSFRPGKGDVAVTLTNLRQFSGRAAGFDINGVNATVAEARKLVAENQASVAALLRESASTAGQARATLEAASASLVAASVNLERASANIDRVSEQVATDPSSILRGRDLRDPPEPQP